MSTPAATAAARVTTNSHVRELKCFADLPADARTEFDYIAPDSDESYAPRFFRYYDAWFDVNEFEHPWRDDLSGWDGAQTQSAFDAILIRYTDESFESVVVGYAIWL